MEKKITKSARGLYRGSIIGANGKAIVVTSGSFKKREDAEAPIDALLPDADRMAELEKQIATLTSEKDGLQATMQEVSTNHTVAMGRASRRPRSP